MRRHTDSAWFRRCCAFFNLIFILNVLHPHGYSNYRPVDSPTPSISISYSSRLTDMLSRLSDFIIPAAQAQSALLSSTPEFDLNDPYLIEKAAELNNDPQRIFEFVRDEIAYEVYTGSLRGARGALWSGAGNSWDQASLLIALLRISGVPARYVEGSVNTAQAQDLIALMFASSLNVVGCMEDDTILANPETDSQLLQEAQQHSWVEFNTGSGFQIADPSFRGAQIGQSFGNAGQRFDEIPDGLRHKVTIRLLAEHSSSFNLQLEETITLEETLITASLTGKPLTISHFVDSQIVGGLVGSTITHTYSPYILIGQNDANIDDDELILGTDYQEIASSLFALANQILTGVFCRNRCRGA